MKKIVVLVIAFMSVTIVSAAEIAKFSKAFINNFKDCDSYQETTTSEFRGKNFTSQKRIVGWRNGFCQYQEVMKSSDGQYEVNCNFSPVQVDEIYEAMKSKSKEPEKYDLEIFAQEKSEKGNPKYITIGTQTIKGDKATIAWAKYQNNPYFCEVKKN